MHPSTALRLIALNKEFYQTFGKEFSATRQRIQPGVSRALAGLRGDETILDLGCGNGELARHLHKNAFKGTYTGLDFSLPLLEETQGLPGNFTFTEADLTAGDWSRNLGGNFDLVFCFAVLHHIPSEAIRLGLLAQVRTLLKPGSRFIHSVWQFQNSEKLRKRIQPWSLAGFRDDELDPGDYLLDWRGGGRGLRYVHHFDEAELEFLATMSRFLVRETLLSDGENGRLGLYQVWEKNENQR